MNELHLFLINVQLFYYDLYDLYDDTNIIFKYTNINNLNSLVTNEFRKLKNWFI